MALSLSTARIAVRIPQRPGHWRATATIHTAGIFLKKTTSNDKFCNKRSVTRGGWRGVAKCGISEWSEGNAMLEEEVFKFMEASEKPNHFPTKQELLSAGRSDLALRILAHGGWMAAGWESEDSEPLHVSNQDADEDDTAGDVDDCNGPDDGDGDGVIAQERPSPHKIIDVSAEDVSEKPEEIESKESGIAAILNRLDRERTLFYSEASEGKKRNRLQQSNESRKHWTASAGMQPLSVNGKKKADDRSVGLKESQGIFHSQGRETAQAGYKNTELDLEENLGKPERWGIPSVHRIEDLESETKGESGVAEALWQRQKRTRERISSETMHADEDRSVVVDKIDEIIEKRQEWMWNVKTSYSGHSQQIYSSDVPNAIMSRIQKLESQLASTLGSLRSGKDVLDIKKNDDKSALEELEKASDAIEFRETEIMKMRAKLRSTRAKLASLEGKMAMEIMEVREAIEEKQKQVEEAQKVLSLLRTARIVWPNSAASEVFLAGSFDGWTSRRRMKKSNAGVFVICMHLYPGRYEIKFIVDGIWSVDPQRPVVYNNWFENNLLVIY